MNKRGGKRKGAGRKLGSKNKFYKKLMYEAVSKEDQEKILMAGIEMAKAGDRNLIKYFLDHFYGKAPQDHSVSHSFEDLLVELESS